MRVDFGARRRQQQSRPFSPLQDVGHDTNDRTKLVIRDLLFQQQIAVPYAPPGSYKSFVTIALCSMLAHGPEWQGRKLKRCRVVYMAGEGFPMFRYRRQAWFKHNAIPKEDDGFEVIQAR